jgi:hypothetical protein
MRVFVALAIATGLALPVAAVLFKPVPATAEIFHPWCLKTDYGDGADNCGFESYEQCKMSMPGSGGTCIQNLWYTQQQQQQQQQQQSQAQPAVQPAPAPAQKAKR